MSTELRLVLLYGLWFELLECVHVDMDCYWCYDCHWRNVGVVKTKAPPAKAPDECLRIVARQLATFSHALFFLDPALHQWISLARHQLSIYLSTHRCQLVAIDSYIFVRRACESNSLLSAHLSTHGYQLVCQLTVAAPCS